MCAEIASGGHDRRRQDNESTVPLESRDEYGVLSRKMNLAETTDSLEGRASGEKAGTAWLADQTGTRRKEWIKHSRPQWKPTLKPRHTPSANNTFTNMAQGRLNYASADQRIGVHKEQNIAAC